MKTLRQFRVKHSDRRIANHKAATRILSWSNGPKPLTDPNTEATLAACRYAIDYVASLGVTGARREDDGRVIFTLSDGSEFPPVLVWDFPFPVSFPIGDRLLLSFTVVNPVWWERLWNPQEVVSLQFYMEKVIRVRPKPKAFDVATFEADRLQGSSLTHDNTYAMSVLDPEGLARGLVQLGSNSRKVLITPSDLTAQERELMSVWFDPEVDAEVTRRTGKLGTLSSADSFRDIDVYTTRHLGSDPSRPLPNWLLLSLED